MVQLLKEKVMRGGCISKEEAMQLVNVDLEELCIGANEIREFFCGRAFDICTIINGKSGRCSENCKFCAQSAHFTGTQTEVYPLKETKEIVADARYHAKQGILRYAVVTSGKRLSQQDVEKVCESYKAIQESCDISLCASHGLLSDADFVQLKAAGVTRYHNNLETSRRYFPEICTTHTYDEKIAAIRGAQKAGLEVCSGGIMGMGETMEDRIDMALELRALGVKSTPINILNPISGTPFAYLSPLTDDEVRRIVAIFRFILPDSALRLAGGRGLLQDKGKSAFLSGANAAISGDMLTTAGISVVDDFQMVNALNFEVKML